jgi:hypothetical protein
LVDAGDRLSFRATGFWVDALVPCSADGYNARFFYLLKRPPRIADEPFFFRLMGRIVEDGVLPSQDDASKTFLIGSERQFTATHRGRLFVFANDRDGYYWNNWGSVNLTIEKIIR